MMAAKTVAKYCMIYGSFVELNWETRESILDAGLRVWIVFIVCRRKICVNSSRFGLVGGQ